MPTFQPYNPEQAELLPPHVRDVLHADHLCFFIHQLVEEQDLSEFEAFYGDEGGQSPYHPKMMVKLWLYAFAVHVKTTRKLEQRIREDLAFRYLAGGGAPDHKTLSEFLRNHGKAIDELFTQVLLAVRATGLAKLGRVAVDSTRIKANASPDRLQAETANQVARWRESMEEEDPDQEPGVQVQAEQAAEVRQQLRKLRATADKRSSTDPDARFLRQRGGFVLGYTAEVAVSEDHFIVAQRVTQNSTDNSSLVPLVEQVERRCRKRPRQVLADSGFFSLNNLTAMAERGIQAYVPDSNLAAELKRGRPCPHANLPQKAVQQRMRRRLRSPAGQRLYQKRKAIVEPVIGTLKQQRGMRQFMRRGLPAVGVELTMAALAYNVTRWYSIRCAA